MFALLLACAAPSPKPSEEPADTSVVRDDTGEDTGEDTGGEDTSAERDTAQGSTSDSAPEDLDPWPDTGVPWAASVTLVADGALLSDGAALSFSTAPAGLDAPVVLSFTLTNRATSPLDLDPTPSVWADHPALSWVTAPPAHLDAGESASFSLAFNPVSIASAATLDIPLTVPGVGLTVSLAPEVPAPLRVVLVGDGGYTAISDDYGAHFTDVIVPTTVSTRTRAVTWGEGRFFRAWSSGMDWFTEGRYAWSTDGVTWNDSAAAGDFWPSHCTFGERFFCVRSDTITWSEDGATVIHEATHWAAMLNAVAYAEGQYLAVGRSARRAISRDGVSWESSVTATDELSDVVYGDGVWVAVGGANRYAILTSVDGGDTWTEQYFNDSRYATLSSVAYNNGVFLAQGGNNDYPPLYRSTDGLTWEPVTPSDRNRYFQLGAVNGWFLAAMTSSSVTRIYRSVDGLAWEPVHTLPTGMNARALAMEGR